MATTTTSSTEKRITDATNAGVDAIVTLCDKLTDVEMNGLDFSFSTLATSPFNFLLKIGTSLGLGNQYKDWLAKMLVNEIPILEYALKGVLLSNIVNSISCSTNPLIPKDVRLDIPLKDYETSNNGKGFLFNIDSLDHSGLFKISPLSKEGTNLYFGTLEPSDPKRFRSMYELCRADDMNAFLWYTMHMTSHGVAETIAGDTSLEAYFSAATAPSATKITITPSSASSLDNFVINGKGDGGIITGRIFKRENGNTKSMCIKNSVTESVVGTDAYGTKTVKYSFSSSIVPITDDIESTNWYTNEAYINKLITEKYAKNGSASPVREYSKDMPLLSVRYFGSDITNLMTTPFYSEKTTYTTYQNKMKVAVLPKAAEIYPFVMALFDGHGKKDKNGHYSCLIPTNEILITVPKTGITYFQLCDYSGTLQDAYLCVSEKNYWLSKSKTSTGESTEEFSIPESTLVKILYECYPKVTIYDLFYDLIFGIKFLDSKVLIANLFDSFGSINASGTFSISPMSSVWNEEIKEIVRNLIDSSDTSQLTDCSFNFSNEEYEKLLQTADDKRKQRYPFTGGTIQNSVNINLDSVNEILSGYNDGITKDEKIDILSRSIDAATGSSSTYTEETTKTSIQADLIKSLLTNLATSIVIQLISPKLALVYEMEKQILGDTSDTPSMSAFMRTINSLIQAVIKEVVNYLLEQLYKFVISQLNETIACATLKLAKEQAQYYIDMINDLLNTCLVKVDLGTSGGDSYGTNLDKVTWADINDTPIVKEEC